MGFEGEGGEGAEGAGVVAGELFDEAVELLFELEEAGGVVEGGIGAVEVEAGDFAFEGDLEGLVENSVNWRERKVLVGAAGC